MKMKKNPFLMLALCCFAAGMFLIGPTPEAFAQDCEEGSGC
jgi:hypothetical protein